MTCFAQPEAGENPKGVGAGCDTQVEASIMKTAATGIGGGDAQIEAFAADAAMIHDEAEIPQQPEV
jgi:hypothetical protein